MQTGSIQRIERLAQVLLVGALAVGVWFVIEPFISAILFAAVIAISTFPPYLWLLRELKGRKTLASLIACLIVVAALVVPAALLAVSAAKAAVTLVARVRLQMEAGGIAVPRWVADLPVVGGPIDTFVRDVSRDPANLTRLLQDIDAPAPFLNAGGVLGNTLLQFVLSVFLLFFFYRDGQILARRVMLAAERVGGRTARDLLSVVQSTVVGVMLGMLGTAVAQGVVGAIGFMIAGAPAPLLLGGATFVFSLIPFGPAVIWGGAAVWIYLNGQIGWAIFMVIYGAVVISSVDNVLKPLLISRSSDLPLAITLIGVLGGLVTFGFMGLFIGPTLLALGLNLSSGWLAQQSGETLGPAPPASPYQAPRHAGEVEE